MNTKKSRKQEYDKEYRKKNKQKIADKNKEYYLKNKEKVYSKHLDWTKKNRKKCSEYSKKTREKYIEKYRSKERAYAKNSPVQKQYRETHKKEINERILEWNQRRKNRVFEMYGGKCACCGETDPIFFTIDHIKNDGYKDGKNRNNYKLAIEEYNPERFQILCFNCNYGKERNGDTCPHVRIVEKELKHKVHKQYRERVIAKFIKTYGGKCVCCGESNPWFLTLHHVNNDGCKRRKYKSNFPEYLEANKEYSPDTFQILCYNCNSVKQYRNKKEETFI